MLLSSSSKQRHDCPYSLLLLWLLRRLLLACRWGTLIRCRARIRCRHCGATWIRIGSEDIGPTLLLLDGQRCRECRLREHNSIGIDTHPSVCSKMQQCKCRVVMNHQQEVVCGTSSQMRHTKWCDCHAKLGSSRSCGRCRRCRLDSGVRDADSPIELLGLRRAGSCQHRCAAAATSDADNA